MAKARDRHPDIRWIGGEDSGAMLPGSNYCFLLHTGETSSMSGLINTLRARRAWSHLIGDPKTGELVQALSFNRAARSLRSGGNYGKTNAMRVIQIELVGFATDAPFWSPQHNKAIGKMIAKVQEVVPFKLSFPRTFYGDRSGFTVASSSARQRMSWLDWYRCDYIVGHQHAPRNDHWDPGAIDTKEIAQGFGRGGLVVPAAPYVPPKFPGYTLREGQRSKDVATLKVMLTYIGGVLDDMLDTSTPAKAQSFGSGTAKMVERLAFLYYTTKKLEVPKVLPRAVGPQLWKFAGELMIWKHALEHQADRRAA